MQISTQVDRSVSPWAERSTVWILNPGKNIDLCFDHGMTDFVFTQKTYQFKRNMALSPQKQLDFFARGRPWRAILVEYDANVALMFDSRRGFRRALGAFPSWSAKDDTFPALERLCRNYPEPGDEVGHFFYMEDKPSLAVDGQPKVILVRNPPQNRFEWQQMMSFVTDMKRDHPEIIFHLHGGKSLSRTMGISIDAFDHPVTLSWRDNSPELLLPNGRGLFVDSVEPKFNHWARLIGESLPAISRLTERPELARAAYRFNLKSLIWAHRNQDKLYAFNRADPDGEVDAESSDDDWKPILTDYRPKMIEVTDRWLCDTCTINDRCPYSRAGAICVVEGTEAHKLSEKFKSRKASDIIDGLSTLLSANTERLEKAMVSEEEVAQLTGKFQLSPQVTTLANAVFDRGIQMARLLDPQVAGQMSHSRTNIGIVNANAGALAQATPQQLMAGVAAKLQEFGIRLEDATMEQVEAVMNGDDPPIRLAIESTANEPD
jgi:hypothetical protein